MVPSGEPVTFKLYANQRLFQPGSGSYVTLDDVAALADKGFRVVVRDARTGADITAFVLFQSTTEH